MKAAVALLEFQSFIHIAVVFIYLLRLLEASSSTKICPHYKLQQEMPLLEALIMKRHLDYTAIKSPLLWCHGLFGISVMCVTSSFKGSVSSRVDFRGRKAQAFLVEVHRWELADGHS